MNLKTTPIIHYKVKFNDIFYKVVRLVLFWVILFAIFIVTLNKILNSFNLVLFQWINHLSLIVIFLGIILGTIQIIYKKKRLCYFVVFFELLILMAAYFIYCLCVLGADEERITVIDGKKFVEERHHVLLSNSISYYKYINHLVYDRKVSIYKSYDDFLSEYDYLDTMCFDGNKHKIMHINEKNYPTITEKKSKKEKKFSDEIVNKYIEFGHVDKDNLNSLDVVGITGYGYYESKPDEIFYQIKFKYECKDGTSKCLKLCADCVGVCVPLYKGNNNQIVWALVKNDKVVEFTNGVLIGGSKFVTIEE